MKRLCDLYIRRARLIGALFCIVPAVAWFTLMMFVVPFREVYLLRLGLAVVVGGWIASRLNEYGVRMWLIKHRSKDGPATVADGALIGAAVSLGITILPPLTCLIATNHPEEAKVFIICAWLSSIVTGTVIGSVLAVGGVKHVSRSEPEPPEEGRET